MTLANFNSNFNWQYRMLKEAAECCGIVPPPPPPPRICCYYAVFVGNIGYTIYNPFSGLYETLDADTVGDVVMPFLGGFGNVLANDISGATTTCTLGFILTEGDPIPAVDIKDDLGNPVVLNWVPYCNKRCYSITVPMSDPSVVQIFTNVEGYLMQTFPPPGTPPPTLDLSDPTYSSGYGLGFQRLYGPQCVFFVQNDGVNYTVSLSNIYTAGPPSFITGTATYTASIGACATTPQTYCYFITDLIGSCSYSYQDRYGFVYNGVSLPTVTSICAAQGTVVANCLPGNSITITGGTTACFNEFSCTPPGDCYWYGKLHDPNCFSFGAPFGGDWILNGEPLTSGTWPNLMVNPPYGTIGNAMQYTDPLSGCGSFSYGDYYFWTSVPYSVLSLPALTGTDPNGNPVSVTMLGPICTPKCYEGIFRSALGSIYLIGFNTAEINAPEYSFYVDLTDPAASFNLTFELSRYYPSPPLNVTVIVIGPGEYTIRIDGLYSLGSEVYVYMDDFVTIGTLNEVRC